MRRTSCESKRVLQAMPRSRGPSLPCGWHGRRVIPRVGTGSGEGINARYEPFSPCPKAPAESSEFTVTVRLHPRSSREVIAQGGDGSLEAWVNAPPVEGEANLALRRILADTFGLAVSRVVFLSGEKSRIKCLRLVGMELDAAEAVIARLPGPPTGKQK